MYDPLHPNRLLKRNYPAAYLNEIGEPGTNGYLVWRDVPGSGRMLLKPSRFSRRMFFESNSQLLGVTVPAGWWGDSASAVNVSLAVPALPTPLSPSLAPPGEATHTALEMRNLTYAGGDMTAPAPICALDGLRDGFSDHQDAGDIRFDVTCAGGGETWTEECGFSFTIETAGPLYQPWYGASPSSVPAGYDIPEGYWAIECRVSAGAWNGEPPTGFQYYTFGASASVWFKSSVPFHRLGSGRRVFSLHTRPGDWAWEDVISEPWSYEPDMSARQNAMWQSWSDACYQSLADTKSNVENFVDGIWIVVEPIPA